jgi:excisionase family DNA binding protein
MEKVDDSFYSDKPKGRRTYGRGIFSGMSSVELIPRRLLDIREVATYTGLSIHTLYTMVSQRRIPFVKLGRLVKFDKAKVDDWIKHNTVMPMSPK